MDGDLLIKKQWFVEAGSGKIEDVYEIDERMVFYCSISTLFILFRNLVKEPTEELLRLSINLLRLSEPSKLSQKPK